MELASLIGKTIQEVRAFSGALVHPAWKGELRSARVKRVFWKSRMRLPNAVRSEVNLTAYAAGARVLIEVSDHCGGLPAGDVNKMFIPFFQQNSDRTGVGLGLSMARRAIEADGGELTVRDSPGVGCVFTISLPRHTLQ